MVIQVPVLNSRMRGSAIVLALGITSLVVILATAMIMSLRMDMRRVEKLETMTARHSLMMASEAMAIRLMTSIDKKESEETTFDWEEDGVKITGAVFDLPERDQPFDKDIPAKGTLKLLHTTIMYHKAIDVYSIFKQQDKTWRLLYRSHGARE
jgi:hypothetical protein